MAGGGWPEGRACRRASPWDAERIPTEGNGNEAETIQHDRTTLQALARELNVCASTVRKVIRSEGRDYKQPPPEQRAEVLQALRRQREERAMEGRA